MEEKNNYLIGIDFSDRSAMISYFQPNMGEPETLSQIAGTEYYQIQTLLAKKPGQDQWFFGDEAKKMTRYRDVVCVDGLLAKALGHEEVQIGEEHYTGEELLVVFLGKVIGLTTALGKDARFERFVITMDTITPEIMELFRRVTARLGIPEEAFTMIGHKESFYYFALSQKENFWLHEVFLFEYDRKGVRYFELIHDRRTKPQTVVIQESGRYGIHGNQDMEFLHVVKSAFENRMVSTAYLVGEGFDGGWMKDSLNFLCKGKRAFIGKNLYSKGACYGAAALVDEKNWGFVYFGDNVVKYNLGLKVISEGKEMALSLVEAGKNWYDVKGCEEFILMGSPEISFIKQIPGSRQLYLEELALTDLPDRPDRTTRLRIEAEPVSATEINLRISDLGFGEFYRSSGMVWNYKMTI